MIDLNESLFIAIKEGNEDVFDGLVKRGANINFRGKNITSHDFRSCYTTPLKTALRNGRESIARKLVALGADVTTTSDRLLISTVIDCSGFVQDLIDSGVCVNDSELGESLLFAIKKGNEVVFDSLIHRGANINSRDFYTTPLKTALEYGQDLMARKLLAMGADVSMRGDGLLITAIEKCRSVTQDLIDSGVCVNDCGKRSYTALSLAIKNRDQDMAILLIEHGAECTYFDNLDDDRKEFVDECRRAAAAKHAMDGFQGAQESRKSRRPGL